MFKKFVCLLVLELVLTQFLPNVAVAQQIQADYLFKSNYFPGEIVTVTGKGFGSLNAGSYVCFDTTATCYDYQSDGIISWTDTEIKFLMTYGIETPKSGYFTLYKDYDVKIAYYVYNIDAKFFDDQWLYFQLYLKIIGFDKAYNILSTKTPVIVAVIDDGVYLNHEDLKNKFWKNTAEKPGDSIDNDGNGYVDDVYGYNFVDDNSVMNVKGDHGTAVAGIIAAQRNNGIGMAGLAETAKIMPVIVCDDTGCDPNNVLKGIRYAVDNGAKIINISLGTSATNGYQTSYDKMIKYAFDRNVLIVTAAGNGDPENSKGIDLNAIPQSPVCNDVGGYNTILGVGSSDLDGFLAQWSNYGSDCVDIYAPGVSMLSLKATGDTYDIVDGTSFSAPVIAGLAANVLAAKPNMRNYTLTNYFIENGNKNNGIVNSDELFHDINRIYKDEGPFVWPADDSVFVKSSFSDVPSSHPNSVAINYLKNLGILEGYADGTFKPDQEVNRAEMLKILIKGGLGLEPDSSFKKDCFPDVKSSDWFAPYVCYAKDHEWIEGYSDKTFRPAQFINKVEALKMLVMTNNIPAAEYQSLPYLDVEDSWYTKYVRACYALNLLEETGNILGISKNVTRGQIAENIFRLVLVKATGAAAYSPELLNAAQ